MDGIKYFFTLKILYTFLSNIFFSYFFIFSLVLKQFVFPFALLFFEYWKKWTVV